MKVIKGYGTYNGKVCEAFKMLKPISNWKRMGYFIERKSGWQPIKAEVEAGLDPTKCYWYIYSLYDFKPLKSIYRMKQHYKKLDKHI